MMTGTEGRDWFWGNYVYQHLQDMLAQIKRNMEWDENSCDHVMSTYMPMIGDDGSWATRLDIMNLRGTLPDKRQRKVKVLIATSTSGHKDPGYDKKLAEYLSQPLNGGELASETDGSASFSLIVLADNTAENPGNSEIKKSS